MNKVVFTKIYSPGGRLKVEDLLPAEKKVLYRHLAQFGATEAFCYDRFFKEGFQQWEIDGIAKCKLDYLQRLRTIDKMALDVRCVGTTTQPVTGEELYQYRLFYNTAYGEQSIDLNAPGEFWQMLGHLRKRNEFGAWMYQYGMHSKTTVARRFSADNWREFERIGIRNIIESMGS
jgi:hypothetical protein